MLSRASIEDLALQTWVNLNPSTQWAMSQIEQYQGLPFGKYLHTSRPRRPRTLTLPLHRPEDTWWHRVQVLTGAEAEQKTDDQAQSAFFSLLPLDVRLMIYDMVLGGSMLHMATLTSRGRIHHRTCQCPNDQDNADHSVCSDVTSSRRQSIIDDAPHQSSGLLSLLLTCRQAYSEAIDTLYSANTFEFTQHYTAFTFLCHTIPQQRLPRLRRLRLHMRLPRHPAFNSRAMRDWQDLWRFFTDEMTGLQFLYLRLQTLQPMEEQIEATRDSEADAWLRPLVEMAIAADRTRGCEVVLEMRHVRHHPARLYNDFTATKTALAMDDLLGLTCAALHERIRISLGAKR